ncbi:respiratory chain complex I subunit 1 family protein [Slackia exigua]
MSIVVAILQALLLMLLAPLASGIGRWLRAKIHTRKGPSIFQDYYDIIKLFKRDDVRTESSTFVSRYMPVLYVGVCFVLAMGMPMATRACPIPVLGDIILIIYLLALPRFFFGLAGVDRSGNYASIGGIRELIVGILVEPSMMLALFATAMILGTTNVGTMGEMIGSLQVASPVGVTVAGVAFAVACYIELGKLPYDVAEAEQELQEGPLSEYSGPSLGMIKVAMTMKQILVVSWFLAIFLPFGSAVEMTVPAMALGLVVYLVKMAVVFLVILVVENLVARVRFKFMGKQTWAVVGIAVLAFVFCALGI